MRKKTQKSYITKLIEYLLSFSLAIILLLVGVCIVTIHNYFERNTSYQIELLVKNHSDIFTDKIAQIENFNNNNRYLIDQYIEKGLFYRIPIILLQKGEAMDHCDLYLFNKDHPNSQIEYYSSYHNDSYDVSFSHQKVEKLPGYTDTNIIKNLGYAFWIQEMVDSLTFISFCQPLISENQTIGLIKLSYKLNTLTDRICNSKLYKSGFFFLTDPYGQFLTNKYVTHTTLHDYLKTTSANPIKTLINNQEKSHLIVYKGEKYLLYHTPLQMFNWQLGMLCPITEMFEDTKSFYIVAICIIIFTILIFSIFIVRIVYHSHKPLQDLINRTQDIAEGNFRITVPPQNASKEIITLYKAFNKMQDELDQYIDRIKKDVQEHERIDTEIMLAQRVQNLFLTHEKINSPQVCVAAQLKQSRKVGGDLYDYFLIEDQFYFAIGDVSGKGMPAALYMGSLMKLLRYVAHNNSSPAKICSILNDQMSQDENNDMYITLLIGILDLTNGIITFCNAGHPYPVYINNEGEVTNLREEPDVPIGIVAQYEYEERQIRLLNKEIILLYTDGITDAEDKDAIFYGKERLQSCIENCNHTSPHAIVDCIVNEIDQHIDGVHQSDDLTLLAIQYFTKQ